MSMENDIEYEPIRIDETFEYKHVIVKGEKAKLISNGRKLKYKEWKELGINLTDDWEHISTHIPSRNVLIFRKLPSKDTASDYKGCYKNQYEIEKYNNREK